MTATHKKFYITTPIYYVNDRPHIGHSYTTILADVLARYHRLLGEPTFFLTGTDEHGQKVAQAAEKAGITPQEQADRTVVRFQELWEKLDITNDDFIRTTEERHVRIVQDILQDLYDRGEIYEADYDGWYDVTSETFVTEREMEAAPPEQRKHIVRIQETNYFFRMSKYQDWLVDYIQKNPSFIQPDYRRNETLGFLRRKLNDLCISRPKKRMAWGIELPFDKDYVTYVWFDALVNYISAIGYRTDEHQFKQWWPVDYHLIGKDILTTHTVYWPTMLKAMNLPMPKTIFAHGWWLSGESKMSKTLGNVVNPMDMIDRFGVDAFRYYLIAEMVLGQDASFTEEGFIRRFNSDLANDLGNLVSRVMKLIHSHCDGRIPGPEPDALEKEEEKALWNTVQQSAEELQESVREMRLDGGLGRVMAAVRATNRYLEIRQPWVLAKQENKTELNTVLYMAAESLRVASALLFPVMPERMGALRRALGLTVVDPEFDTLRKWGGLAPGTRLGQPGSLFPRIRVTDNPVDREQTGGEKGRGKQKGTQRKQARKSDDKKEEKMTDSPEGVVDLIEYDDFARVQLRTAMVMEAGKVEGSSKLLKLNVMMGEERRQLVAGIALNYEPEDIIGKIVVVVANLKPATIRGIKSEGMVLAAVRGSSLRLVTIDGEQSTGAVVQ